MAKYVVLGIILSLLLFSAVNLVRVHGILGSAEKRPAVPAATAIRAPAVSSKAEPVKVKGFPFVETDSALPVLSSETEAFRPGVAVADGVVEAVQDGVVRVRAGSEIRYVRTTATVPSKAVVSVVGKIYTLKPRKLEQVMLSDGRVVKVGEFLAEGEVIDLTEGRAVCRRGDGGECHLLFGVVDAGMKAAAAKGSGDVGRIIDSGLQNLPGIAK